MLTINRLDIADARILIEGLQKRPGNWRADVHRHCGRIRKSDRF